MAYCGSLHATTAVHAALTAFDSLSVLQYASTSRLQSASVRSWRGLTHPHRVTAVRSLSGALQKGAGSSVRGLHDAGLWIGQLQPLPAVHTLELALMAVSPSASASEPSMITSVPVYETSTEQKHWSCVCCVSSTEGWHGPMRL